MSKSNKRVTLPEFIQMEAAECGAASLKIMLEHFGTKISINTSKKAIGMGYVSYSENTISEKLPFLASGIIGIFKPSS